MKLNEKQLAMVDAQIKRLIKTDSYYGKIYRDAGIDGVSSQEDFEKLPFSSKADLRYAYPLGIQAVPDEEVVRIHSSSGTTGKPVIIPYTAKDVDDWSLMIARCYEMAGITDKDRIKEILPDINTDNILGAGYTKDDGYFDGTMISNTFVKKMQANGGVVKTGVEVTEIIREGDTAVALKTADGVRHDFDVIVDCTGPWSRFTGRMVGLDVPIWHTKAEAFFLCPPNKHGKDFVFPVLKYPAFYALRAGENVFICKSHLSMNLDDPMHAGQWDPNKLPQTGGTDDYFIDFLFDQMESYVPGLADSGLVSSWLSYRAEPRDFLPIIGETPVKNYLLATGYGGNGVIEAPAVSRDLAKFIMRGESTLLLEEWAFKRLLK